MSDCIFWHVDCNQPANAALFEYNGSLACIRLFFIEINFVIQNLIIKGILKTHRNLESTVIY